jgi:hypothetical protein
MVSAFDSTKMTLYDLLPRKQRLAPLAVLASLATLASLPIVRPGSK